MKKLYFLTLILLVSCSGLSRKKNYTLRFIGDIAFNPETKFEGVPFGGISGITFDKKNNKLIGISDDRSNKAPARFYHLDLDISESHFDVKISKMITLKAADSKPFKKGQVDFEGIALTPQNELVISSEGDNRPTPRIPPSIMIFNRDGSYKGWLPIPNRYLPEHKGEQTQGPRNNMAFESLGLTQSGKYLFTGTEDTMVQDGATATLDKEGVIRLMRFKRSKDNYKFDGEFAYPLSTIPAIPGKTSTRGINGLVELIPLSKNHIISMERAWTPENRRQTIRIYKVTIQNSSTEVSKLPTLVEADFKYVQKTLIANLDDYIPLLKNGKRKLDNIEGLALGPILPNGNQTLIVISDDNFNKRQRTMLMAFEIL